MTKSQIVEILKNQRVKHFGSISPMNYPECADAILALRVDVPTDEEIDTWVKNIRLAGITDPGWFSADESFRGGIIFGAKAMRDGKIIKKE